MDHAIASISPNGNGILAISENNDAVVGDSNNADKFDFKALTTDGSNGYGETSSIRWKTNIRPINNPLIKLGLIRGVYFNWKETFGGKHALGFIAEEVGKVLPEIVVYEENGIDAIGMDYGKMTPLLVEAANAMRREYQEKFAEQEKFMQSQYMDIQNLKAELDLIKEQLNMKPKSDPGR